MLIHITKSLLPYLGERLQKDKENHASLVGRANEMGDQWQWHAHRFPYGESCCVLVCHDSTGFILALAGIELPDYNCINDIIKDTLMGSIEDLGFTPAQSKKIGLKAGPVIYDDQSAVKVKEMLSVAWQDLRNLLVDRPNLLLWNPLRINELINERIIKKDDQWSRPDSLFKTFLEERLKSMP